MSTNSTTSVDSISIMSERKEKPDGARIFSRCFAAPPPSPGSCCGAEPQQAGGWASDTPSLLQCARPEEPGPRSASHSAEVFHGGYTVYSSGFSSGSERHHGAAVSMSELSVNDHLEGILSDFEGMCNIE
ncbi:hypothetical protein JOQ06_010145 [Pogonophryne albipinna]|uniref:Uncharacterized protein n=1 Tax=Pogonophryne albipinna TaxID=1090488 RepID=A0AAD6FF98_9TELE|nr:hypothetical protein JOQ06_010145 [Pogonophryne albipinna]